MGCTIRVGKDSPRRIPVEEVLMLYREKYFDFNIRHFHEKFAEHGIDLSYTWALSKEIGALSGQR